MWIETDLEPDDVLAIYLLPDAKYYVVGEGNAHTKYLRMCEYARLMKNDQATIIEGLGSVAKFPLDGKEFDHLPERTCNEVYLEKFTEFARGKTPVMFSFKPMRELVAEYVRNPDLVKKLLANVTLYAYGGFNFRCLFEENKKELTDVLHCFKRTNIYESHFVSGESNSMDKVNAPKLYQCLSTRRSSDQYVEVLFRLIHNWNEHIVSSKKEALKNPKLNPSVRERNQKVIDNVKGHVDFQFVIADFGLAAIYQKLDPMPVKNLEFKDYTAFECTSDPSSLYDYCKIATGEHADMIVECIHFLYSK